MPDNETTRQYIYKLSFSTIVHVEDEFENHWTYECGLETDSEGYFWTESANISRQKRPARARKLSTRAWPISS